MCSSWKVILIADSHGPVLLTIYKISLSLSFSVCKGNEKLMRLDLNFFSTPLLAASQRGWRRCLASIDAVLMDRWMDGRKSWASAFGLYSLHIERRRGWRIGSETKGGIEHSWRREEEISTLEARWNPDGHLKRNGRISLRLLWMYRWE